MDDITSCHTNIKQEPARCDAPVAMDPIAVSAGLVEIKKECLEEDIKEEEETSDLTCCVVASGNMCLGIKEEEPSATQIDSSCGLPVECSAEGSVLTKEEWIEDVEEAALIDVTSGICPAVKEESVHDAPETDRTSGAICMMTPSTSEVKVQIKKECTEEEVKQESNTSDLTACTVTSDCLGVMLENGSQGERVKQRERTDTEAKPYACDVCKYTSKRACDLKTHMRTHTGEKPYACEVCDFRCSQGSDLKRHLRTHTGEKPYACEVCNFKCSHASYLKTHMRTHTGEKRYVCEVCNFKCSQGSDLKTHMRTHTGEKRYVCEVCYRKFIQSTNLKTHMKTHTGEKPFACEVCSFRCSHGSDLKRHLRTHTGEKPYACEVCNFKCSQASYLKNHMRTHTGEKPHVCEVCNFRFGRASHLKRHLRTHTRE